MYVKDFRGKLIEKSKARKIKNEDGVAEYYEEGISCIKMPDEKWYRTTVGKIVFDHSVKAWVFSAGFKGSKGIIDKDGTLGSYSDKSKEVLINRRITINSPTLSLDPYTGRSTAKVVPVKRWEKVMCISENLAIQMGYTESIADGTFYPFNELTKEELSKLVKPSIPPNERTNVYSLDDDKNHRNYLENLYDNNKIHIIPGLARLAMRHIPFTFGLEIEVQNGHIPSRLREPLGFRVCRDGSLDQGIELVSVPMEGGKGLTAVKLLLDEAQKRCEHSNKCSMHVHFGDVRRDRLYIVSLWELLTKIQDEFRLYFPFSRTNSIREDRKIYAALLPNLKLNTSGILKCTDEEKFKARITKEFEKIYLWLNNGVPLGQTYDEAFIKDTRERIIKGRKVKQYCYRTKKFNFTTAVPRHAVQGHKWQRPQRYLFCNLLNFFFSTSRTVEARIHEATFNFDRVLIYMLSWCAILKYAEKFNRTLSESPISFKEIIEAEFEGELRTQIWSYWENRKKKFSDGISFRDDWKTIEAKWSQLDRQERYLSW